MALRLSCRWANTTDQHYPRRYQGLSLLGDRFGQGSSGLWKPQNGGASVMIVTNFLIATLPKPILSQNGHFFLFACRIPTRGQATTAEACRSMPQHLFWGPVGGGFEGCCSTLKIGLELFWEKISDQNITPIPVQSFVRDGQYSRG